MEKQINIKKAYGGWIVEESHIAFCRTDAVVFTECEKLFEYLIDELSPVNEIWTIRRANENEHGQNDGTTGTTGTIERQGAIEEGRTDNESARTPSTGSNGATIVQEGAMGQVGRSIFNLQSPIRAARYLWSLLQQSLRGSKV